MTLTVNGQEQEFLAKPATTLLSALRETLGLTAAKRGCAQGTCGSCTVIVDGRPVPSCLIPVVTIDGAVVRTLEGLACRRRALTACRRRSSTASPPSAASAPPAC